jgi:hypothetical protein
MLCHAMKPSLSGGGTWRVSPPQPCAVVDLRASVIRPQLLLLTVIRSVWVTNGAIDEVRESAARLRRDEEGITIRSSDCATLVCVASCAVLYDVDMLDCVNGGSCEVNVKSQ